MIACEKLSFFKVECVIDVLSNVLNCVDKKKRFSSPKQRTFDGRLLLLVTFFLIFPTHEIDFQAKISITIGHS